MTTRLIEWLWFLLAVVALVVVAYFDGPPKEPNKFQVIMAQEFRLVSKAGDEVAAVFLSDDRPVLTVYKKTQGRDIERIPLESGVTP